MSNFLKTACIYFALITISIIGFIACSSTGMQRSEKATTTMQTMDNTIKLIVVQLDATGSSLDELTLPSQMDTKKAFDLYSENIFKMEKMEKEFSKHADEMKERGKDYFEEWQVEGGKYKNSQIQELSEQRRIELSETYSNIARTSIGVKEAFKTYVSDGKEVQIYISNDLTRKGIDAIAPVSRKLVNDGENLKYAIKNIQSAIERVRTEMIQAGK